MNNFQKLAKPSKMGICELVFCLVVLNNMVYIDDGIIKRAAKEAVEILTDEKLAHEMTEENYNIAVRNYSYENLKEILKSMGL